MWENLSTSQLNQYQPTYNNDRLPPTKSQATGRPTIQCFSLHVPPQFDCYIKFVVSSRLCGVCACLKTEELVDYCRLAKLPRILLSQTPLVKAPWLEYYQTRLVERGVGFIPLEIGFMRMAGS